MDGCTKRPHSYSGPIGLLMKDWKNSGSIQSNSLYASANGSESYPKGKYC